MDYDNQNVFAKILRGELPCDKVYENGHVLAFRDVRPQAPNHVLVIPKGAYVSMDDFSEHADDIEVIAFWRAVGDVARQLGAVTNGYRILANHGREAHQEVFHFHVHIFSGCDLGGMIRVADS